MWKHFGPFIKLNKRGVINKSIDKLIINGKTVQNDNEKANALNNCFSTIGNELSKEIPISNHDESFKDCLLDPIEKVFT